MKSFYLKTLLFLLVLVLVLSAAVYVLASGNSVGKLLFPRVFRTDTVRSVESVLERTAPLQRLDLAAMTVKVVFPQDLYPQDYDWAALLTHTGYLDEGQKRLKTLYETAKAMKIDLSRPVRKFLVLTFDITCSLELSADTASFRIFPVSDTGSRIVLTLPAPAVTGVIHRDMTEEEYIYPEMDLAPGDIASAVDLSKGYALETALDKGIEEAAERRGTAVMETLMKALGFSEVEVGFISP